MGWKRTGLFVSTAVLLGVLAGCRTQTATPAAAPPATAAKTQYVELTYPQSDDQGHYQALAKTGNLTVSGIIAALTPPTGVVVNGVTVKPYLLQDMAAFGTPTGYSTYGFSAPATVTPTTLLTVALQALGLTTPAATFAPDSATTYTRLLALAGAAPDDHSAQYRLGNALLARRNYADALAAYRRSVALRPLSAWGYDGLGQTYVLMLRPKDAVIHFKKAKKLQPKWAGPRYRLAQVLTEQRRYDDARIEYREAIMFAPGHPGLHRGYAEALYHLGRYPEAWQQVHLAKGSGVSTTADFEKRLRERLPESAQAGHAKQASQDRGRQDGVRAPGPHVVNRQHVLKGRQDGQRRDGPHASGKTKKNPKGN